MRKLISLHVHIQIDGYIEVATNSNSFIGFKNRNDRSRTALGSLYRLEDAELRKTIEIRFDI